MVGTLTKKAENFEEKKLHIYFLKMGHNYYQFDNTHKAKNI